MAKKKPIAPVEEKRERATTEISHCNFTNENSANQFTRDAVVALSKALEANAGAILETARALRGGNQTVEAMMRIEQPKE